MVAWLWASQVPPTCFKRNSNERFANALFHKELAATLIILGKKMLLYLPR